MKVYSTGWRGYRVYKNRILTKPIMLCVCGWTYGWVGYNPHDQREYGHWARNEKGELIIIGKTMKEADEFCFKKYTEYYDSHPEEHKHLPDPRKRKKVVSKIVTIECDE